MNTDKIYAEAIANEYAPKGTSKVIALNHSLFYIRAIAKHFIHSIKM